MSHHATFDMFPGSPCAEDHICSCIRLHQVAATTGRVPFGSPQEICCRMTRQESPLSRHGCISLKALRSSFQICGFCPRTSFVWDYPPYPPTAPVMATMKPADFELKSCSRQHGYHPRYGSMVRLFVQKPVSVCFNP